MQSKILICCFADSSEAPSQLLEIKQGSVNPCFVELYSSLQERYDFEISVITNRRIIENVCRSNNIEVVCDERSSKDLFLDNVMRPSKGVIYIILTPQNVVLDDFCRVVELKRDDCSVEIFPDSFETSSYFRKHDISLLCQDGVVVKLLENKTALCDLEGMNGIFQILDYSGVLVINSLCHSDENLLLKHLELCTNRGEFRCNTVNCKAIKVQSSNWKVQPKFARDCLKQCANVYELLDRCEDVYCCYYPGSEHKLNVNEVYGKSIKISLREVKIPELNICCVKDATIIGAGAVVTSSNELLRESLMNWLCENFSDSSYKKWFLKEYYLIRINGAELYRDDLNSTISYIGDPVCILSTPTDTAFSHFLFETFAKLFLLTDKNNKILNKYKFIVNENIKNYQIEMLNLLGVDNSRIIIKKASETYLARLVITIQPPSHNNSWCIPQALQFLRRFFYMFAPIENPDKANTRFFDRRDDRSNIRRLDNEDAIKNIFPSSVVTITPGRLVIKDKAILFKNVSNVIAQYGGGLQLAFLAEPKTKIIVIQSPNFYRIFIDFLACFFDFEVLNLRGKLSNEQDKSGDAAIIVNENDLEFALKYFNLK